MRNDDFLDEERRRSTDDSYDEPLDETLMAHARDYHTPDAAPREAMWEAISGRTGRASRAGRAGEARVLPFRRAVRVMLPIAAVLVAGILIGRMTSVDGQRSAVDSQRSTVDGPGNLSPRAQRGGDSPDQAMASSAAPRPQSDTSPVAREPRLGTGGTRAAPTPSTVDRRPSSLVPRPTTVFSVAAERHFAQAESFLTLFRTAVREGQDESLAPATARELLVNNRLLMDSPAADDPRVKHLLGDIELVLAQIAQMPAEGRQADARIITDGLDAGGVLTRIRSEVTSGPVAAVPQGAL